MAVIILHSLLPKTRQPQTVSSVSYSQSYNYLTNSGGFGTSHCYKKRRRKLTHSNTSTNLLWNGEKSFLGCWSWCFIFQLSERFHSLCSRFWDKRSDVIVYGEVAESQARFHLEANLEQVLNQLLSRNNMKLKCNKRSLWSSTAEAVALQQNYS